MRVSDHPLFDTWANMLARCEKQSCPAYKWYGARGIRVCERWHDFRTFVADMGPKPAGTSLDRINNDGNYEPDNCRWAARSEQNRNKRQPKPRITNTFAGETKLIKVWAKELGVTSASFYHPDVRSGKRLPIPRRPPIDLGIEALRAAVSALPHNRRRLEHTPELNRQFERLQRAESRPSLKVAR